MPKEAKDKLSATSIKDIQDVKNNFDKAKEKRRRVSVNITGARMCGVFVKNFFKKHAQTLTKMGIKKHLDEFEFMVKPQQRQVVMGCSQCGSMNHGASPVGTCPNDVYYDNYSKRSDAGLLQADDLSPKAPTSL